MPPLGRGVDRSRPSLLANRGTFDAMDDFERELQEITQAVGATELGVSIRTDPKKGSNWHPICRSFLLVGCGSTIFYHV